MSCPGAEHEDQRVELATSLKEFCQEFSHSAADLLDRDEVATAVMFFYALAARVEGERESNFFTCTRKCREVQLSARAGATEQLPPA